MPRFESPTSSKSPRISIILPTYNGEKLLEQSVASCLAQSFKDFELIIIDDCSKDSTPEIIARLAASDPRIRAFRNEPNRKLPASLNRGFAEARADLLTWTSDDNLFRPNALERMISLLDGDPKIDLVYSDYTTIDDRGTEIGKYRVGEPEQLVDGNCVGACFLYRRKVHDALNGYAEDLFLAEDYDFWLRAAARFNLAPLHEDLYLYRYHERSLTTQQAHRTAAIADAALERNLGAMKSFSLNSQCRGWLRLMQGAFKRGQPMCGVSFLSKAFMVSPVVATREIVRKSGKLVRR